MTDIKQQLAAARARWWRANARARAAKTAEARSEQRAEQRRLSALIRELRAAAL